MKFKSEYFMKLLAVETSTEACSVALSIDNEIIERFRLAPREHTRLILPMIDELLAEAGISLQNLDGLAFSRGPGSFTGVRVATGVIQGIAFGADLAVVPVSTLGAMAQACFDQTKETVCFTAMDARIGEIFWGVYQKSSLGFAELVGEEAVILATNVLYSQNLDFGFGVGSAWSVYAQELSKQLQQVLKGFDASYLPHAMSVARLGVIGFEQGLAVPVELAMPVYLRDKVAKTEAERKI